MKPSMTRRTFSHLIAAASLAAQQAMEDLWGGPVVDCHHHLRRAPEQNIEHLNGCGVSNAMMLAGANSAEIIHTIDTQYPGRVLGWFASANITNPDAEAVLTGAVKSGAIGLGEIKFHVAA